MKKWMLVGISLVGVCGGVWAETISTDKSGFDKIYNVIDDAVFDLRYYSPYNFTGKKIRGYKAPVAYMTKEALAALAVAAADLRAKDFEAAKLTLKGLLDERPNDAAALNMRAAVE